MPVEYLTEVRRLIGTEDGATAPGIGASIGLPGLGARALVDSGVFLYGTPGNIAAQLAEFDRAGVDEVVVNVAGVYSEHGRPDAVRDLQEILAACREATNRPMNG